MIISEDRLLKRNSAMQVTGSWIFLGIETFLFLVLWHSIFPEKTRPLLKGLQSLMTIFIMHYFCHIC